ncbi:MAG: hypothetical protein WA021_01495 [Minisyncoccia bacterium]
MDFKRHMFSQSQGGGEWDVIRAVSGDHVNAYHVVQPKQHTAPRILRFGVGRLLILKNAT